MAIRTSKEPDNLQDLNTLIGLIFDSFKSPGCYSELRDATRDLCIVKEELKHDLLIAYDDNSFVGFCTYGDVSIEKGIYKNAMKSKGLKYEKKSFTISMIAVMPEQRAKGVGKELVKRVIEEHKKIGHKHSYVTCFGGKCGNSYKMFKSSGYTELTTMCYHYQDGSEGVVMYKEI
ncbi:GNAT family N-acetyltransferase [Candidatus Woesearchaeota archaeon]|nr:GNAT family N-acetyltransferase [Candidatus Woesearchaeota archaeon]